MDRESITPERQLGRDAFFFTWFMAVNKTNIYSLFCEYYEYSWNFIRLSPGEVGIFMRIDACFLGRAVIYCLQH